MADLISRAAAIDEIGKLIKEYRENGEDEVADGMIIARRYVVKQLPAVDTAPVVHGRWIRYSEIFHDPEYTLVKCSVCGGVSCCDANYCPDCGAKMDSERRDAE